MKRFIGIILLLGSMTAFADTYKDEQTWINVNAFFKLNENWKAYAEWQPRFYDYSKYNGVTLHRGALGRDIGHGFTLWGGYGFMTWNDRKDSKAPAKNQHEDRFFGMLIHNHLAGQWKITNRTRYEFRQFRHDDEFANRMRHMVRAQYKFNNGPWAGAVWDEYFYNQNSIKPSRQSHGPVTKAGFDQNRAFVGVAYLFGESQQHTFETGYMNNYVNGARRDRQAHVWMNTLSFNF